MTAPALPAPPIAGGDRGDARSAAGGGFGRSAYARRYPLVLALGLVGIGALALLHVGFGSGAIAPGDVTAALAGRAADPMHRQIVWELRLPRTLIALFVRAMLGVAGAILQALTRNPLASPGLTGVSAGGVVLVVAWLAFGPRGAGASRALPLLALAGGLAATGLVYALSWRGGSDPARLALTGVLVGAVLTSVTSLLLVLRGDQLGAALTWIIGSLTGRVWAHWALLWPWALVALPVGLATAGLANALHLGDAVAAGLGLPVERTRVTLLVVAAALTAGAVAVAGAIGFVGLIAPHAARRLVGDDNRRVFPLSAVLAGALLLGADVLAQAVTLEFPLGRATMRAGLPVGALTALLGAPFFLYLILREER